MVDRAKCISSEVEYVAGANIWSTSSRALSNMIASLVNGEASKVVGPGFSPSTGSVGAQEVSIYINIRNVELLSLLQDNGNGHHA